MKFSNVIGFIFNFMKSTSSFWRPVFLAATLIMSFNAFINALWSSLFSQVDAFVGASLGDSDFTPLGLVNYCVPLDTMLTFILTYAGVRLSCAAIRMTKSFVPSISG